MSTTTCIALLRGINVGGNKPVAMPPLRAMLAKLGFDDVRSILQSGNLVFRVSGARVSARRGLGGLENMLEAEATKRLGLHSTSSFAPRRNGRLSSRAIPFAMRPSATPRISS